MKKSANSQAEKHAQTEHQRQQPAHGWGPMFRGALAELSGHSWLQNFLIGLALLLVWPLIGVTVMKTYRATIIGFGFGVTILIWIGVLVLLHQAKEPTEPIHTAAIDTKTDAEATTKATSPSPTPKASPTTSPTPLSIAERPYVVVESAMLTDLSPNKPINAFITIVNKGRTPAQHVSLSLQIAAKAGTIYWLGFGKDDGRRPVNIAFLAAGDRVRVQGAPADDITLDAKFFDEAMKGRESLMIHGLGSYEDMAGTEYPMEYAFGYVPSSRAFAADWGGPNRKEKWQDEKEKKKPRKPN